MLLVGALASFGMSYATEALVTPPIPDCEFSSAGKEGDW